MSVRTLSVLAVLVIVPGGILTAADDFVRAIPGWGKLYDPDGESMVEVDGETLILTSPLDYVDNYPPGRVNAPRVSEPVTGGFSVEVKVTHLDTAQPDSVLETLGDFPTAYHAGALLIWENDQTFVRFERVSMNNKGNQYTRCDLQIWREGERAFAGSKSIAEMPTNLRLERRGTKLHGSYSQDGGGRGKELERIPGSGYRFFQRGRRGGCFDDQQYRNRLCGQVCRVGDSRLMGQFFFWRSVTAQFVTFTQSMPGVT